MLGDCDPDQRPLRGLAAWLFASSAPDWACSRPCKDAD
jgi:hypothetical protein